MGHDIHAAATMSQLRSMLRAFTWDRREPPSQIVGMLDRAMHDLGIATLATVTVLRVDTKPAVDDRTDRDGTDGVVLRWSCAGHPPAVLIAADGTTTLLDGTVQPPVGVAPRTARLDNTHVLMAGSTVVLYTDGLIETRHHDLGHGIERLRRALTTHHRLPLAGMLDAVIADVVGEQPGDDVAVIALRAADAT